MQFLITFLAGYLLGSIPFGFLIVHLNGKGDIREIGSGNIGATNVLRTGNKNIALITLFLDGLKAAMALLIFFECGDSLMWRNSPCSTFLVMAPTIDRGRPVLLCVTAIWEGPQC